MKKFSFVLPLLLSFAISAASQTQPKLTISSTRARAYAWVHVQGTGFSVKKNVSSHLRKPDGSEYPVLPLLTNDRGEFTHDIDTLLLPVGTMELWVVDDATQVSSNVVKFDVTTDR